MQVKSFDVLNMVVSSFIDDNSGCYVMLDNKLEDLKNICAILDMAIAESNTEAMDVEIDKDNLTTIISIHFREARNSVYDGFLYDTFMLSQAFKIKSSKDVEGCVCASFVFDPVVKHICECK